MLVKLLPGKREADVQKAVKLGLDSDAVSRHDIDLSCRKKRRPTRSGQPR